MTSKTAGLIVESFDNTGPTLAWLADSSGRLHRFRFANDLAYLTVWGPSATVLPGWGLPDAKPILVAHVDRVTGDPNAGTLTEKQFEDILGELVPLLKAPSKTNPLFGDHPDTVRHMVADLVRRQQAEADTPAEEDDLDDDDDEGPE